MNLHLLWIFFLATLWLFIRCNPSENKSLDIAPREFTPLFSHNEIQFHLTGDKKSFVQFDKQRYRINSSGNLIFKNPEEHAYTILNLEKLTSDRLLHIIKNLLDKSSTFFLILNNKPPFFKELNSLKFNKISKINNRKYLAYSYNGIIAELINAENIDLKLPAEYPSVRKPEEIKIQYQDRNRFIAHAGGMIDGEIYTNSLEALNQNYQKGFRLFELDILKTSDRTYVANHSWKDWDSVNNVQNYVPTHEEFMKKKIFHRFTPLDLNNINQWFKQHPDAFLITDKVNNPKDFATQFIDKNRLMMEVFDLTAVDEAHEVGITPMLNWDVFLGKNDDEILETIQKHHITYLTASRKQIAEHKNIFLKIKDKGVRIYLFHVNYEKYKDEKYVFLHELDYAYGMYADKWEFINP